MLFSSRYNTQKTDIGKQHTSVISNICPKNMNVDYNYLKQVDDSSKKWTVKVRVVRFWRDTLNGKHNFNSFNLLLLDEKVSSLTIIPCIMFVSLTFIRICKYFYCKLRMTESKLWFCRK